MPLHKDDIPPLWLVNTEPTTHPTQAHSLSQTNTQKCINSGLAYANKQSPFVITEKSKGTDARKNTHMHRVNKGICLTPRSTTLFRLTVGKTTCQGVSPLVWSVFAQMPSAPWKTSSLSLDPPFFSPYHLFVQILQKQYSLDPFYSQFVFQIPWHVVSL